MANNNRFDGEEAVCFDIDPSGRPRKIPCGGPFIKGKNSTFNNPIEKNVLMVYEGVDEERAKDEIRNFIDRNKVLILFSFLHIEDNNKFYILLIRDVFLYLYNKTDLLNLQILSELKRIPPLIYNIVRNEFLIERKLDYEEKLLAKIRNLHGFIYLGINTLNEKIYVGQTIRTIEEEWGEIIGRGETLRRKREANPNRVIRARYILNAIAKYGKNVWYVKLIDIAYSQAELDEKEIYYIDKYDTMNPKKGYNLTEGGRAGGRLSERTKKRVSESVSKVWDTPEYKEMMSEIQKKAWEGEKGDERREKVSESLLETWDDIERREKASERMKDRWSDDEERESLIESLREASIKKWQDPTPEMLKALKNMHQKTRKDIENIKDFLIDIKKTKNQYDFFKGDLFKKYGIKSHMTFNSRINEILGGFGVNNHGEAHRFFYDRSIDEVMKYLDNPKAYNIFRDPFTRQFFKDVHDSRHGVDLHHKYRVWHKQGLAIKIDRIVGKFGINNYTALKRFLRDNGVDESLKYFEQLEKGINKN